MYLTARDALGGRPGLVRLLVPQIGISVPLEKAFAYTARAALNSPGLCRSGLICGHFRRGALWRLERERPPMNTEKHRS